MKVLLETFSRNINDKQTQNLIDLVKEMFMLLGLKGLANDSEGDTQITHKINQMLINVFPAMTKMIEQEETIYPVNKEILMPFFNLLSKLFSAASKDIDPSDDVARGLLSGIRELFSTFGKKSNISWGGQIQSNNELLPWTFFNLLGTLGSSALQKKASSMARDEVAQRFEILSFFNTLNQIPGINKKINSAQEVQMDTFPTYADKLFDESITNENAVLVEGDTDFTDEAKTQLWGNILRALVSDE